MYQVNGKLYTDLNLTVKGKEVIALVSSSNLLLPTREEMKMKIDELTFIYENVTDAEIQMLNAQTKEEQRQEWEELYEELERPREKYIKPKESGYIYVIKEEFKGTYKIGRTNNVGRRFNQFGVKLPFEWTHVFIYKVKDTHGLEDKLHKMFSNQKVNGEWFELSDTDIEYLGNIMNNPEFAEFNIEDYPYE